jgi:hypothetical protein
MTAKTDFTEEEWNLVREGPPAAGMIVLTAERGGSFRESWALAKAYGEARKEHGESQLLDELASEKPDVKKYESAEELDRQGLAGLRNAVDLLERKATPEEVESYRRFVLAVANRVAEAHREQGQAVSEAERGAIERIAESLGTTAS